MTDDHDKAPEKVSDKASRERRKRNIALALVLGGAALLFYLMSIVQWHENFGK